MQDFGRTLTAWRKAERLTQGQLAILLGVSQQAVSNWERGLDIPNTSKLAEVRRMMAQPDGLSVDSELVSQQQAIRTLFDFDGVRLYATSRGFRKLWPTLGAMLDAPLADFLVNEAAQLNADSEVKHCITRRQVIGVSGVSEQHLSIESDIVVRHRWFVRFRTYGHRIIGDMTFEECQDSSPAGIERLFGPDFVRA